MEGTITKTTSDQLKFSNRLETDTAEHGESLAQKVTRLVWGEEAPPISLILVVRALLLLLQLASRALRDADSRHVDELADDDPARAERTAAADALRAFLASVQNSISGVYGEAYAGTVGLLGAIERRPDMLVRRARAITRQLRKLPAPAPLLEGASIDIAFVASRVEERAERLATAIASVTREETEADRTLVLRDEAGEHWERVARLVGNFMVGLAEVAGEFAIAARIRPTTRRLRGDLEGDDLDADIVVEPPVEEDPLVGVPGQDPAPGGPTGGGA